MTAYGRLRSDGQLTCCMVDKSRWRCRARLEPPSTTAPFLQRRSGRPNLGLLLALLRSC